MRTSSQPRLFRPVDERLALLQHVTFFDCLHDMGDPAGAATHVRQSLAPDGVWMIVEPFAHGSIEANLNLVGRIFYSASKAQEVGLALGAQAGERRLRDVVMAGGFSRFRRAAGGQIMDYSTNRP